MSMKDYIFIKTPNIEINNYKNDKINLSSFYSSIALFIFPITICIGYIIFCIKYIFYYNETEIDKIELVFFNKNNENNRLAWDIKLIVLGEIVFVHTCGMIFLTVISKNFIACYIILIMSIFFGLHCQQLLNFFNIEINGTLLIFIIGVSFIIEIISICVKKFNFIKNVFVIKMAVLLTLNQLKIWPKWGWWIMPLLLSLFEAYTFLKESQASVEKSFNFMNEIHNDISYLLTYTSQIPESSDNVKIVDIKNLTNDKELKQYTYYDYLIGNFLCYFMLMGYIVTFNEWNLIIICYISIIVGILLTRHFQVMYKNFLPDLIGPTILCLSMLYLTNVFISPFIQQLFKYFHGKIYFS
ncbi:Peptidase A22A, presenilin family-containing protein [Strongyloides ratti]|uniref:Peptidase A22A, presenilin family-containing protein n=1 Tax=Strongyloides ratti TaxID=34506 RepID=A0A090MX75_STRRB|nr:Peptidase A22A, presenilin family-containing protein [Strongyloides ratti]CEF64944.1 Peptidase A22A, presenilin family-containing protein [Strongyloides ratti]